MVIAVGTLINFEYKPESPYVATHMGVINDFNCSQVFLLEDVVMKKLTIGYVREKVEEAGYELLHKVYTNSCSKLLFRCDKGHTYRASWDQFRRGDRCPYCFGRYKTIEDIKKYISKNAEGYRCLNDYYNGLQDKLKIECDEGHIYKTFWCGFQQGQRCPICANNQKYTIGHIKERVVNMADGYQCLSKKYVNALFKLEFMCNRGHKFEMKWNAFQQGQRCPICAGNHKLTIAYIKKITPKMVEGYQCLSHKYINNNAKLKFVCNKGHEYKATWGHFNGGSRCPVCSIESRIKYTEDVIIDFLSYRKCINRISNQNYCKYYYQINPESKKRSSTKYHLDHIYTVTDGFNNDILPNVIANPTNLQMLPAIENIVKQGASEITKEELFKKYDKFIEEGVSNA